MSIGTDGTTLDFSLTVAGTAVAGPRSIGVTTTGQNFYLANAFTVLPASPANVAPTVNAGIDQTITLPAAATLSGSASDDKLPAPPALTLAWSQVNGPGTVTFANAASATTTATFSAAGTYTLRLTANDGALPAFDDVVVTVNAPANVAPTVNAGPDQTITLPAAATLSGTVTDDNLPAPPALTLAWSQVNGPGTATFANAASATTTATFSAAGTYTLRLTANDGALSSSDDVVVTVNAPANVAPTVNAGPDQTNTLPAAATLSGTVTDDNLPAPPALTLAWSQVNGPGTATFANAASATTTATFSAAGTYTLRLTANDGALPAFDDVMVTVNPAPNGLPTAVILGPTSATSGQSVTFDGSTSTDPDQESLTYAWTINGQAVGGTPTLTLTFTVTQPTEKAIGLTVTDPRGGTDTKSLVLTVTPVPVNHAPVFTSAPVVAGTAGSAYAYTASASDSDQEPVTFALVQAPEGMTISAGAIAWTPAPAQVGNHVVIIQASDGHPDGVTLQTFTVVVSAAPVPNTAPSVSATADPQIILPATAALAGTATDDGKVNPLRLAWTKQSGPGVVTFADASAAATTAAFGEPGTYVLWLTADDGEFTPHAEVTIVVRPPAVTNTAPEVSAGSDVSVTLPAQATLVGTIVDKEQAPDALVITWSAVSGPAAVSFGSPHAGSTSVAFTEPGKYVLQLSVSDGQLTSTDEAVVSVQLDPATTDRAPPIVTLYAPKQALPGAQLAVVAQAYDDVRVSALTFEVDGTEVPPDAGKSPATYTVGVPDVAAPGKLLHFRAVAHDPSGNAGSAEATLTVVAQPDLEPPVVQLFGPARSAAGAAVTLVAEASDSVGVASVTFSVDGVDLATVAQPPYEASYLVPADRAAGSPISAIARAVDFAGNPGDSAITIQIIPADQADTTPPVVALTAPAEAIPGADVALSAVASDAGGIAAVEFSIGGAAIATVVRPPYRASYRIPVGSIPGAAIDASARATDFAGLSKSDVKSIRVTAPPQVTRAVVTGEAYDDTTGLRLPGVTVALVGSDANGVPYDAIATTDAHGRFLLRGEPGLANVRFSLAGWTTVQRAVTLQAAVASEVLDARLTRYTATGAVSAVLGGTLGDDTGRVTIPAGVLSATTSLSVTSISQQGLAGLLPRGWSPVGGIEVSPREVVLLGAAALRVANPSAIAANTSLVLVRWDEGAGAWRVAGSGRVASDGAGIDAEISATGQYAWLVPDSLPAPPPAATAGELLAGVTASALPEALDTVIEPKPQVMFYRPGVSSSVRGRLTGVAEVPSGVHLWSRIAESYQFVDGGEVHPEPWIADLVFFQVPGTALALQTTFVVTPSLEFEAGTLAKGVIGVELFVPPGAAPSTPIVGPDGGTVSGPAGTSLILQPGSLADATPITLSVLQAADLGAPLPDGTTFVAAVQVAFTGELARSGSLAVPRPAALTDNGRLLLVKLEEIGGLTRLLLAGVARVEGDLVVSDTIVNGQTSALEGVRGPGRYVFLQSTQPIGFTSGLVRGVSGAPFSGAIISSTTLAVVSRSTATGAYFAAMRTGLNTLTAADLAKHDSGSAIVFAMERTVLPLGLQLVTQPPVVTAVSPVDHAVNVALGEPVVVTFSEPIAPASLAGANAANAIVAGASGPVAVIGSLSYGNTVLTLRPAEAFQPNATYTLTLSAGITDESGNPLRPFTSSFSSLDTQPPPTPAAGQVTASVPDANGQTIVTATGGTVSPTDTVYIVNLTTGTSIPVPRALFTEAGGFRFNVSAGIADKLRIRIVDAAGNETTVDLDRFQQTNADGSVSAVVDAEGGIVEGPGGVRADVPVGAFPNGAVVTVNTVPVASIPVSVAGEIPLALDAAEPPTTEQYTIQAAVSVDFGGAAPERYINVSVPASGTEPPTARWTVAQLVERAGQPALSVVDTAKLREGRIVTSSPPFPGISNSGTYVLVQQRGEQGVVRATVMPADAGLDMGFSLVTMNPTFMNLMTYLPMFVGTPSPAPMGFPLPAGRVTLTENAVKLTVDAKLLAPIYGCIEVVDPFNGQTRSYALPQVDYRMEVTGAPKDGFDVSVQWDQEDPTPVTAMRLTSGSPDSVVIRLDPYKIPVAFTKAIVKNRKTGEQRTFVFTPVTGTIGVPGGVNTPRHVWLVPVLRDYAKRLLVAPNDYGVAPSPDGAGNLLLQVQPQALSATGAAIDRVEILGAKGLVRDVPSFDPFNGTRFAFDGDATDGYQLRVTLRSAMGTRYHFVPIPRFEVTVKNPVTNEVVRTISGFVPPPDQPLDLGAITDDVATPFVVSGPSGVASFDPSGTLEFTFSEQMDADSLKGFIKVYDSGGHLVAGEVRVSGGNRVATFVPASPLKMGERYTVVIQGAEPLTQAQRDNDERPAAVRDAAGNPVATMQLTVTTFTPHSLGSLASAAPFKDIAIRRKKTNFGSTTTLFVTTGAMVDNLVAVDATVPSTPVQVGAASGAMSEQRLTVIPDATFTTRDARTFNGDLAITAQFSVQFSSMEFYDVTDPTAPALLSSKALTVNPDLLNGPNTGNTIFATAYAKGIAAFQTTSGVTAYAAVEKMGVMGADVGANVPGAAHLREPVFAGNATDIVAHGTSLYAIDQRTPSLSVLDQNLAPLASLGLSVTPRRLRVVNGLQADLDGDSAIGPGEIFTLAVVGGDNGIAVVDLRRPGAPVESTRIPIPGTVRDVEIDPTTRRVFAGADLVSGPSLLMIDLSDPTAEAADADGDGFDDRIIYHKTYAPGFNGLRLDRDRGLLYIAHPGGLDVWGVYNSCCDIGVDMVAPIETTKADGKTNELLRKEKEALQMGIAAGLKKASDVCGVAPAEFRMWESGSSACLWDDNPEKACDGNYQPGVSDHDISTWFPDGVWSRHVRTEKDEDGNLIDTVATVCVLNRLAEQFTDEDGKPISITVPGDGAGKTYKFAFHDISFIEGRLHDTANARYNVSRTDPALKGDAVNDMALGRQLLLLKHVTESRWVQLPEPYAIVGKPTYPAAYLGELGDLGAQPDLAQIDFEDSLRKMRTRTGIPTLEGYEWTNLMEWMFAKGKGFLRIPGAYDESSAFHDLFVVQMHLAGKAGIRAALARTIADADGSRRTIDLARRESGITEPVPDPAKDPNGGRATLIFEKNACLYVDPDLPPESWATKPCGSLEEYMASAAAWTLRPYKTEGPLGIFTLEDVLNIYQFYQLKSDRITVTSDAKAHELLTKVARYISKWQGESLPAYTAGRSRRCAADERFLTCDPWYGEMGKKPGPGGSEVTVVLRDDNMEMKKTQLAKALTAHLGVAPHVFNRSFRDALDVNLTAWFRAPGSTGDVVQAATRLNLEGGDNQYPEYKVNVDGTFVLNKGKKVPLFEFDIDQGPDSRGKAGRVVFGVDLQDHKVREAERANNAGGFVYYLIDPAVDVPPALPSLEPPVTSSALAPDLECTAEPTLTITQQLLATVPTTGDAVGVPPVPTLLESPVVLPLKQASTLKLTVTNPSATQQTGVVACSTLGNRCYDVGTLIPNESKTTDIPFSSDVPVVVDAIPTAFSAQTSLVTAPPFRIVVGCEEYTVVSLSPDPNDYAPLYPVMRGGKAVRYFRVVSRRNGQPLANAVVTIKVEGAGQTTTDQFITDEDGVTSTAYQAGETTKLRPGMDVSLPGNPAEGTEYVISVVAVNGQEPLCGVTPQTKAYVRDRTFTRAVSFGGSVATGGALKFKFFELGAGVEFGASGELSRTTKVEQSAETIQSFGVDASAFGSVKVNLGVGVGIEASAPGFDLKGNLVKGEFDYNTRRTKTWSFGFDPSKVDAGEFDAVECAIAQVTLPVFGDKVPALVKLRRMIEGEPRCPQLKSLSAGTRVEHSRGARGGVKLLKLELGVPGSGVGKNNTDAKGLYGKQVKFDFGFEAKAEAVIIDSVERRFALTPPDQVDTTTLIESYTLKHGVDYSAGVTAALGKYKPADPQNLDIATIKDKDLEKKVNANYKGLGLALKADVLGDKPIADDPNFKFDLAKAGFGEQFTVAFEWDVAQQHPDVANQLPSRVAVSFQGRRYGGWLPATGGPKRSTLNVPRGGRRFVFTDPAEIRKLLEVISNMDQVRSSWVVEQAVRVAAFQPDNLTKDFENFLHFLLTSSPSFVDDDLDTDGQNATIGGKVGLAVAGVGAEGTAAVNFYSDQKVAYTAARGHVVGGESFVLERYPRALFPSAQMNPAEDLFRLVSNAWNLALGLKPDLFKPAQNSVSPSSATTIDNGGATVTVPPNSVTEAKSVGLQTFEYGATPGPVASVPTSPYSMEGRPDVARYGIGGFHQLAPDLTFLQPAHLVLKYTDADVAGFDESLLAVYRMNPDTDDWERLVSAVNAAANEVSADILATGLYTLGLPMPSGSILLTAEDLGVSGSGDTAVRRFRVRSGQLHMNTGGAVADGAAFTVRLSPDGTPEDGYGDVVGVDADPALDGFQVLASGGALEFVVAFPAPNGVYLGGAVMVFATPGTAHGEVQALVPEP